MMQNRACEEGQYTQAVYGSIKEGRYDEAVRILEFERQNFPRSRAALSVLAFCYYHMQDFKNCAATYEDLIRVCPDVDDYKLYYAQALFKAAMYPEALRAAIRVDSPQHQQKVVQLQASIKYEQDELSACKQLLDGCLPDDPDTVINFAAIAYKEGEFEGACNVCGGSHMYCRLCGVSYCIMCEEAGCDGEPYGIHDSSQSADGRHDSESE